MSVYRLFIYGSELASPRIATLVLLAVTLPSVCSESLISMAIPNDQTNVEGIAMAGNLYYLQIHKVGLMAIPFCSSKYISSLSTHQVGLISSPCQHIPIEAYLSK